MKVFIDAGHRNSQYDTGSVGADGTKESALALQISKKLKAELDKLGNQTYISRLSDDGHISLGDRVKKANNLKSDLYVSIHINCASDKNANGFECLCYPNQKNRDVASRICEQVVSLTNQRNRGQKDRDDLYVLNATNMDSYLVECGFISNDKERDIMKTDEYQDKVVIGILKGLGFEPKNEVVTEKPSEIKKDKTLMIIDGVETYVESILVGGHNYIKLRDLDNDTIDVMYDQAKKCAILNTKCDKHKESEVSP
ncbi:MAG: N-acetylmuramoyl-L-alanine amidase [Cellulosilyticaceae bacterium]